MNQLLICNAIVVSSDQVQEADVLINEGKITKIAKAIDADAETVIDANGLLLFPGGIDAHTHMDLPVSGTTSSDDFESGTRAALFGGTTTIIDFANQTKGESPLSAVKKWHSKADGKCYTDYAFHIAITDLTSNIEEDIDQLINVEGITSFKTFQAYPTMQLAIDHIDRLMKIVAPKGGMITNHAEIGNTINELTDKFTKQNKLSHKKHPKIHPPEAEIEAVQELINLAIKNKCPSYVVHTTTGKACEIVTRARKQYPHLFLETCPQYLILNESVYSEEFETAAKYIMSPPVRTKKDITALWKHIKNGEIDVIATDHCPFTLDQKSVGKDDVTKIPNGAPGVENRFELFYHHAVNLNQIELTSFVNMISTKPAKLFGLYPKKGDIIVGADADLVLFDPDSCKTISSNNHHMRVDYNIFEGQEIRGSVQKVISKGVIAIDGKNCFVDKGCGEYLKRRSPNL